MRKEYGRVLRELFTERLHAEFPEFKPARVSSRYVSSAERPFRWIPIEPLHCWIILVPDGKGRQAFTVEIAWSQRSRFPELSMRPSVMSPPDAGAATGLSECAMRLSHTNGKEAWWDLPDPALAAATAGANTEAYLAALQKSMQPLDPAQALADVAPRVASAIELLRTNGVPHLRTVAAAFNRE